MAAPEPGVAAFNSPEHADVKIVLCLSERQPAGHTEASSPAAASGASEPAPTTDQHQGGGEGGVYEELYGHSEVLEKHSDVFRAALGWPGSSSALDQTHDGAASLPAIIVAVPNKDCMLLARQMIHFPVQQKSGRRPGLA
jgi:hypothetical protein